MQLYPKDTGPPQLLSPLVWRTFIFAVTFFLSIPSSHELQAANQHFSLKTSFESSQNSNGLVLYLFISIPLEALLGRCSKKVIWRDPCYITFLEEHFES